MKENTNQTSDEIRREKIPLTCIICPMGCSMEVTVETDAAGHKKVTAVKDNGCKRGEQYAVPAARPP